MVYGKLLLVISSGDEREFLLEKDAVIVGRASDCDIVLPSPKVSRRHARITFSRAESTTPSAPAPALLEDLGSTYGTFVNDKPVTTWQLYGGDVLNLAGVRLRFEYPEEAETGQHTIVDLNIAPSEELQEAVLRASVTHTLIDVSPEVAKEASRQDATFQVVVPDSSPHLVVREGNASRRVALGEEPLLLGRSAAAQVALAAQGVSRRHAELRPQGNGHLLTDLGSTNGTSVNGQLLTAPRMMVDGDVISMGDAIIVYRRPPAPSPYTPTPTPVPGGRRPVVVIPGLMGSELRRGNLLLWPNYPYLLSHPFSLMQESGPVDVIGMISEVVVVPYLIKLDAYNRLTRFLESSMGYKLSVDLLEFPYDWRQDNRASAAQLSSTVRAWREKMGHGPVTIIAHSMGGLITRYFLDQLDGKEQVERFIVMGTPHRGTPKTITSMLPAAGGSPLGIAREKMRLLALSMASAYQILPQYDCVIDTQGQPVNVFEERAWLASEYHPFLDAAYQFVTSLRPEASIPTVCIFGYGQPTPYRVIIDRRDSVWKLVRYEMGPVGDGGVPEEAAILPGADIHPVRQSHGALFTDDDVQRRLRYELLERPR